MSSDRRQRGPMGGMGMMASTGEKPRDFKGTIRKLLNYMREYKVALGIVAIFSAGSTAFSIVGPKILGDATTEVFQGLMGKFSGGNGIDFEKIARILTGLMLLYLVSTVFGLIQGMIMTRVAQNVIYRFRKELSEKIHRLPMGYFDLKQHGEVLSLITNDVDTLSMSLNQTASQMITSFTMLAGILIMMLSIDWIMTLVALVILPLSGIVVSRIVKSSQKFFRQQQEYLGHVNGQVEETFSGIHIVQAFNNEENVIETFEGSNRTLYRSMWKSQFLSGLMMPVMTFIGNLGYVAVAILGGYFAAVGRITVGNIQSFIAYSRNFTQPVLQVAQVSNMLQSMTAAAERIFAFLNLDVEKQDGRDPAAVPVSSLDGQVSFDRVRFGYDPDKVIIHSFCADIQNGQKIAIVGPTGAGKTTMVKLLMRFYDVLDGAIRIDGMDIRDFDRRELRSLFGMVLQDTWLFNGTIMENIRYGKLDATDEEVIEAAKAAHAHHFIQTLPDGYHMELNEEISNISQGQKQLLTLARAILADKKILILDEATSSVDTRTEILIQKAMDRLMQGRTSFIIAHRLSTIRNADLILVMDNGDIVEQDRHEDLLSKGGFYANLYNSQFEKR